MEHIPVLLNEVIESLNLKDGDVVVDATLGLGGHTEAILKKILPSGRVVGIDRDARNIELAKTHLAQFKDKVRFVHASFVNISSQVSELVDAVLFDLGFSSVHVDDGKRGFSFMHDGPLDMRYDIAQELTAELIVNEWSQDDLAKLFRKLGQERFADKIAKEIIQARKLQRLTSTVQLAEVILKVAPRVGKQHPATRVFQALRIAVNDELAQVQKGLEGAVDALKPGGLICVISFHSLEDKVVKDFFKSCAQLEVITKRPIRPNKLEIKINPRARSAKLRVARKK